MPTKNQRNGQIVESIEKVALSKRGRIKGKYLYAMGVIERDKLKDHIAAVRL